MAIMETINAYPTLDVERYNLTRADLRTKGLNLYIIVEREHNYYDDSDTNFLYYDADHDCLKTGQWTTRGYCGDLFYDYPSITQADESVKAKALDVMRKYVKSAVVPVSFTDQWWKDFDIEEYNIPCVVDGGRKYRGEGVLVKLHRNESYYGNTESVSIWTGEKTVFANPRFVKVDAEMVFARIFEMIDGMTFSDLYTFINNFYDMRYKGPTTIALEMVCPIVATSRPTLADKRRNLREWVAEKFNGNTPEEQERITHCIMIKKYGKDIEE